MLLQFLSIQNYIILGAIFLLILLYLLVKKAKTFVKSSLLGVFTLFLVNAFSFMTTVSVGVNLLTFCTALILGIPGTILMILVKIF